MLGSPSGPSLTSASQSKTFPRVCAGEYLLCACAHGSLRGCMDGGRRCCLFWVNESKSLGPLRAQRLSHFRVWGLLIDQIMKRWCYKVIYFKWYKSTNEGFEQHSKEYVREVLLKTLHNSTLRIQDPRGQDRGNPCLRLAWRHRVAAAQGNLQFFSGPRKCEDGMNCHSATCDRSH